MRSAALAFRCLPLGVLLVGLPACLADEDASTADTAAVSQGNTLPASANWALRPAPFYFTPPNDAIVIGQDTDGTPLYSCRASWNGGIHPGKTRSDWYACRFGWGGAEQSSSIYQVLVPAWTDAWNGVIPVDAIPFGNEASGSPLYVCRASYGGSMQVGKLGVGFDGCYVPYGGQELHLSSYSVLTGTLPLVPTTGAPSQLANAIVGGNDSDGATLYPCLGAFAGGLHPGKTRPDWNGCDVSYGGGEHWLTDYEVLIPELDAGPIASRPWVAGNEAPFLLRPPVPLGICQHPTATDDEVGKYKTSGACNYTTGGQEIATTDGYYALTAGLPTFAPHSFDFGNLSLGTHRTGTITFVADFDDDITVNQDTGEGFSIAGITSWKSAGSANPAVDQHVAGNGPLHVRQGERVTVDIAADSDPWNYVDVTNVYTVSAASWSFRVPVHAKYTFLGDQPVLVLGRASNGYSDQTVARGVAAPFSFTVTNVGTQPTTYTLSAAVNQSGLSINPIATLSPPTRQVAFPSSVTINPGEVQSWSAEVDIARNAPYVTGVPVTGTINYSGGTMSVVDTVSVIATGCAQNGANQYDGMHEACCPGTGPDSHGECRTLPCAPQGQTPNNTSHGACCPGLSGSPCQLPPTCAPRGSAPNTNGHAACCNGLSGNPCQPTPPCAPQGKNPNSGGYGACCPGLAGTPCNGPDTCTVWVRAHATTCTNYYDGTPSSLSHTLCADGCGSTQQKAQDAAKASLGTQTCLGDSAGCCEVALDQNFNVCGE